MIEDAIKEIKRAEENGAQLVINAQAESKYRIDTATEETQRAAESEEARLEKEFRQNLEVAEKKASEIADKRNEDAAKEALRIETDAKARMAEAVDMIIEEIRSSWQ
ncbi:MAG: hypothetical protein ACI3XX_04600 [Eubacteriales bacterium]